MGVRENKRVMQEIKKGQVWENVKTGERVEFEGFDSEFTHAFLSCGRTVSFESLLKNWKLVNEKEFTSTYSGNIDLEPLKIKPLFGITSDKVVQSVINDLNERSRVGVEKYGVTLEREDLNLKDWLQHAYEETLDKANYLKRAILELEK